jgi:hypothetical protein
MATTPSTTVLKATGRDVGTGKVITLTKSQPAQLSVVSLSLRDEQSLGQGTRVQGQ